MLHRQLEVFRAVMDTGSATAAARQLGVSQPSVSRNLAQLQAQLDLVLFRHQGGKLVPTAHAMSLRQEAEFALHGLERLFNLTAKLRAHDAGVLRIAAPNSFCETLLPRIIAKLVQRYRNLRYSVEIGRYPEIATMLAKREADIGILRAPFAREGVAAVPLAQCISVCALPAKHRLAELSHLTIDDIASEPLILLGRNTQPRQEFEMQLRRAKKVAVIRMNTQSVSSACGFVNSGLGIAVLPELLAAPFASRSLVLRPLQPAIAHEFLIASPLGGEHGLHQEFVRETQLAVGQLITP
jgi:DNA-binding transcriptional LysR family regulator